MVLRTTEERSDSLRLKRSWKTPMKTELGKKKAERFAVNNLHLGDRCIGIHYIIFSSVCVTISIIKSLNCPEA